MHLEAPENVDAFRLEVLALPISDMDDRIVSYIRKYNLLPKQTELERTRMTVPIHTVEDIEKVVRSLFRLNMEPSEDYQKHRLDATFTALRSLNELSGGLEAIETQREKHRDRTNVQFHVGQVVQHQEERWRGVIASWGRPDGSTNEPSKKASLTSKDYSDQAASAVTYDVILDAGDAHAMGSSSGWSRAAQGDLKLMEDSALLRIQSNILKDYFTSFQVSTKRFVPNDLVAYQFPSDDTVEPSQHKQLRASDAKLCLEIVDAVQTFATRLDRCILDESSFPSERGLSLLSSIQERLRDIISGDVFSRKERYTLQDQSPIATVSNHLHALLNLQLELVDINHQRRESKENKSKIKFALGDIVRHKMFGFRGVVATWNPKPVMDVRRWDGLQHIENPMEKPFYHVLPDQNDCIKVFGGERPARYVCEDNLELCPESERTIKVDMEPVWAKTETGYEAPQAIKYRYGDELDDDGITERCMRRMQDEFNSLHLLGRNPSPSESMANSLSIDKLSQFISIADSSNNANAAQETIKEMRKAHVRRDVRWRFDSGISELLSGRVENAMEIYRIVLAEDPTFAEAWNKLATCQFMYGRHEEALESTKKVLELDPNHLQAIIGMGLIHYENDEYQEAVNCFRKALNIDPWSPVGAKLSLTLDLLDKVIIREEISD